MYLELFPHMQIFHVVFPRDQYWDPFYFFIYVNDMSGAVCNILLLYADDSAILVADKCLSNIETVLQNELEIVSEWLVDNKLSLHLGKTESILFGSRPRLKSQRVDQIILSRVFKVKSGQSPDYMIEHFIPASSIHSFGTRFRKTGCFSIPKVKCLERNPLDIMVVFYGTSSLMILGTYRGIQILK